MSNQFSEKYLKFFFEKILKTQIILLIIVKIRLKKILKLVLLFKYFGSVFKELN